MRHLFHQQTFLKQLSYCENHTNVIYPDLFMQYCENCFYFKYIHFWQHSRQYFLNKFISLGYNLLQCKATVNLTGLFSYFQHGEVFSLPQDGFQYPRIFRIHSRIIPFYSRNFTFIAQEITNTLLSKIDSAV